MGCEAAAGLGEDMQGQGSVPGTAAGSHHNTEGLAPTDAGME